MRACVLAAILIVGTCGPGCARKEPPSKMHRVACTCPYLTDFDGVAKHALEVCVPEGKAPEAEARQCASKLTHGPTEECVCAAPGGKCDGETTCRSLDYK